MNTLVGYDLVPEPKIIDAALRACRRLNDFASAVRILEVVKVSEMTLLKVVLEVSKLLIIYQHVLCFSICSYSENMLSLVRGDEHCN